MEESITTLAAEPGWTSEIEDEASENGHLIEKGVEKKCRNHIQCRMDWRVWAITTFNVAIFAVTVVLAAPINAFPRCKEVTDLGTIKSIHSYSPILNDMIPEIYDVVFNGSFVNYPPSLFRSDPSKELDAAWAKLDDVGRLLITEEDVLKLGKDPKIASKASETLLRAMGRENKGNLYYAQIDAFHQLHCLNEIRRHVYWDHYHKHKWGAYDDHTPHPLHWTHISHCIENIRQNIMCNADVEMITSTWTEGQDWPFPDFNLHKKCRSFEQLQEWQDKNRIPEDLLHMLATPDDVELQTLSLEVYYALNESVPENYPYDHEVMPHRAWDSSW